MNSQEVQIRFKKIKEAFENLKSLGYKFDADKDVWDMSDPKKPVLKHPKNDLLMFMSGVEGQKFRLRFEAEKIWSTIASEQEIKLVVWEQWLNYALEAVKNFSPILQNETDPFEAMTALLATCHERRARERTSTHANAGGQPSFPSDLERVRRNLKSRAGKGA